MQADYDQLSKTIAALTEGETDEVALMATLACEFHHADDRFDWTGFYRNMGNDTLKIGPYQGGHGCLVIPFSRGVCGAAARSGEIQLVPDVDAFPGHIACDCASNAEIVVPIIDRTGELIGVLDLDSPTFNRFDDDDAAGLRQLVQVFIDSETSP